MPYMVEGTVQTEGSEAVTNADAFITYSFFLFATSMKQVCFKTRTTANQL
jgi:hypothetical protein